MKPSHRLVLKQSIKYFLFFLVFVFGILMVNLIVEMPLKAKIILFSIISVLLFVSILLDALSVRDVFPFFRN